MNDTKWRELQLLMTEEATFMPRYRLACVRGEGDASHWDADWRYHLSTFNSIEWLDIDPVRTSRAGQLAPETRDDRTREIQRLLDSKSIPHGLVDGYHSYSTYVEVPA